MAPGRAGKEPADGVEEPRRGGRDGLEGEFKDPEEGVRGWTHCDG